MDPFTESLDFADPRHLDAHRFLVDEAALLDRRLWKRWLELMAEDVRYLVPVTVTVAAGDGRPPAPGMAHMDEDLYSLTKRVERLETEHAWTEDPPSRTRHLVTNVRTSVTEREDELGVESSLLLFRSRGDDRAPEIICANRVDVVRRTGPGLRLRSRLVRLDEAVLRTQNLAIFL